jgi:hypothetical protein
MSFRSQASVCVKHAFVIVDHDLVIILNVSAASCRISKLIAVCHIAVMPRARCLCHAGPFRGRSPASREWFLSSDSAHAAHGGDRLGDASAMDIRRHVQSPSKG